MAILKGIKADANGEYIENEGIADFGKIIDSK